MAATRSRSCAVPRFSRALRPFGLALVLVLPAACSHPAQGSGAPLALPAKFTDHPSVALADAETVHRHWWQSFKSPELDALEQKALAGNPDLEAAVARMEQAQGGRAVAAAPLAPSVNLQAEAATRDSGPFGARPSIAAVASYEVDFWGRNRARARAARSRAEAARFDRDTLAMTLTASVASSYFNVRSLRARLALARRIAADARHTLRLVEAQRQVGTGSDLQVQLQRNLLAGFDQAAASIERQIEQEQHTLAILVGLPPEGFHVAPEGSPEPATPTFGPDTPLQLLAQRPDIAAAEARLAAARLDVKSARAAFLPSLSLTAVAGLLATPAASVAVLGGSLGQPLFTNGALGGQLKIQKARQAELLAAYRATVLGALRDVEDALSEQAWLERENEAADRAVATSSRAAFLADAQYQLGAADYLTVLTSKRSWYQAEDAKAQIHARRLQAVVMLCRALGGGFEKDAR